MLRQLKPEEIERSIRPPVDPDAYRDAVKLVSRRSSPAESTPCVLLVNAWATFSRGSSSFTVVTT